MKLRKQMYPTGELGTLVKACLAFVDDSAGGAVSEACQSVHVSHAVASLLSTIGASIPTNCPKPILKTIASIFHALFQSNQWPLIAATMSSLLEFLSTLHKAHSSTIPQFFPQHFQPMLKSRMQGNVFDLQSMRSLDPDELQFSGVFDAQLNLSRARRRNVYARSDLSITDHPTAVTITKEGKIGAILIIPRDSSFTTSDLVLNGGFVPNQVGTVTHAIPTNDGSSCALQIQDYNG